MEWDIRLSCGLCCVVVVSINGDVASGAPDAYGGVVEVWGYSASGICPSASSDLQISQCFAPIVRKGHRRQSPHHHRSGK